ncbi:HD-GYP domain-containing protein [Marinobacter sp. M216]|uniref:HD-GYP domain-containing protein n=1 Tax=Marinobacter albus TaxID=3030833 RepID=A0ABT7HFL1_9GAMM|nr:HD-GYP domain-containing protein [Marinobacter sp. M216]MDK9558682.1 HD-GYP domain-containing protein [Marinobacter sp. M216]
MDQNVLRDDRERVMGTPHQEIVETCIDVADLAVGMHVVRLDRPWEETNFLLQGFVVRDTSEIDALRSQCEFVYIEGRVERPEPAPAPENTNRTQPSGGFFGFFKRGKQTTPPKAEPARTALPHRRVTYINKVDLGTEMKTAAIRFEDAQKTAKSIMSGLRLGRTLDLNNARAVVNGCVDSVLRNENALLLLTKIKNQDEYTAEHSINVSILSAAFGKHLGLLEGEIRNLALCGLLHDVGKVKIPEEVLNKPGALTPDEFQIMRKHTTHGRTILMGTSQSLNSAVDVAYSHHERVDGQGYPRGLGARQIPYFAKLVGLVDTYDAITSNRIYDTGRASMQALEIIHKHRDSQFDKELAEAFIQMIGVYPPGSIVEMLNGEVAIVVETHRKHKLKPRVLLVREADKSVMMPSRHLDLMQAPRDGAGHPYQIAREVPDGTHGIVLKEFVDEGLILSTPVPEDPDRS